MKSIIYQFGYFLQSFIVYQILIWSKNGCSAAKKIFEICISEVVQFILGMTMGTGG